MDNNEYVYCTNCFNFKLDDENIPYCMYYGLHLVECDLSDCEDGKQFKDRPYYEPIK